MKSFSFGCKLLHFSGYICSSELQRVLTQLGDMKLSSEEAKELIEMVDVDDDNRINYSEFVTLFTSDLDNWAWTWRKLKTDIIAVHT